MHLLWKAHTTPRSYRKSLLERCFDYVRALFFLPQCLHCDAPIHPTTIFCCHCEAYLFLERDRRKSIHDLLSVFSENTPGESLCIAVRRGYHDLAPLLAACMAIKLLSIKNFQYVTKIVPLLSSDQPLASAFSDLFIHTIFRVKTPKTMPQHILLMTTNMSLDQTYSMQQLHKQKEKYHGKSLWIVTGSLRHYFANE